jgi:hypothetical protein
VAFLLKKATDISSIQLAVVDKSNEDFSTPVHELGHNLNFVHTVESNSSTHFTNVIDKQFSPKIPKYATINFMDYFGTGDLFYYYQWLKAF